MGMGIRGQQRGGYFDIFCDCGERTKNEYLGWDPSDPYFRATCPKCGDLGTFKVAMWSGLPTKPDSD
jgi:hypothetical protein